VVLSQFRQKDNFAQLVQYIQFLTFFWGGEEWATKLSKNLPKVSAKFKTLGMGYGTAGMGYRIQDYRYGV